jgi:hypothetical protein
MKEINFLTFDDVLKKFVLCIGSFFSINFNNQIDSYVQNDSNENDTFMLIKNNNDEIIETETFASESNSFSNQIANIESMDQVLNSENFNQIDDLSDKKQKISINKIKLDTAAIRTALEQAIIAKSNQKSTAKEDSSIVINEAEDYDLPANHQFLNLKKLFKLGQKEKASLENNENKKILKFKKSQPQVSEKDYFSRLFCDKIKLQFV